MATITATRLVYKQSNNITDCTCLRIVRRDGTVYRFTSLDKNLSFSEKNVNGNEIPIGSTVTYITTTIGDFSAYGSSIGEFGQIDIEGLCSTGGINRRDVVNGLFDRARLYIFTTNYNRPIEDEEILMTGLWGEFTTTDNRFIAKFSSLIDVISLTTGRVYQAPCDAQLGTFRCGVPLLTTPVWDNNTSYNVSPENDKRIGDVVRPTVDNGYYYVCTTDGISGGTEPTWPTTYFSTVGDGTVEWTAIYAYQNDTTVFNTISTRHFTVETTYPASGSTNGGPWTNGYVEFLNGDNTGVKIPIERSNQPASPGGVANIYLLFSPPNEIFIGDEIRLTLGCNKTKAACGNFFNTYNYQGFTDIPGRVAFVQGGQN